MSRRARRRAVPKSTSFARRLGLTSKQPTASMLSGGLIFLGIMAAIIAFAVAVYFAGFPLVELLEPVVAGSARRGFLVGLGAAALPVMVGGVSLWLLLRTNPKAIGWGCAPPLALTILTSIPWFVLLPPRHNRGNDLDSLVADRLPGAQHGAVTPVIVLLVGFWLFAIGFSVRDRIRDWRARR